MRLFRDRLKKTRGQTSIEYALIVIIILAITTSIAPILKSAMNIPFKNARDKVVAGPNNPPV